MSAAHFGGSRGQLSVAIAIFETSPFGERFSEQPHSLQCGRLALAKNLHVSQIE